MDYHIIGGDGKVYGPKPESEVRDWIREGRLNAESRICRAGGEDWLTLDRLPEFAMDLSGTGTPDPTPAPVTPASGPTLEPLPGPQSPPLPGPQSPPLSGAQPPDPAAPYGQPQPPGYPGQIPGMQPVMVQQKTTNPMAITGMIMGIISLFSICCIGWPFIVLGIIFSSIGLSQIKSNPHQEGKGMAIADLVCSIVGIVMAILSIVLNIAVT